MQQVKFYAALAVAFLILAGVVAPVFSGCTQSGSTGPLPSSTPVRMSALFSKGGTSGMFKMSAVADSLRIDSAVVVFSRIKFLQHADSVALDSSTSGHGGDGITVSGDSSGHEADADLILHGPFVVHIHDTVAIDFANQSIPAGTYDGISFKVHRLEAGEAHEDADEHHHQTVMDDSSVFGGSIVVWGAVMKSGAWQNFMFVLNDELSFKVKGNFIVPAQTSTLSVALNVDMAAWFRNPADGTLLDPTDTSSMNLSLIRDAISKAFGSCRGGHDGGDGHVDG